MNFNSSIKDHSLLGVNIRDHTPKIAAIDLGTNSCRLLVASVNIVNLHRNFFRLKTFNERQFKIIDSYAKVVVLGEGVKQTGLLTNGAIERTIEALKICKRKIINNEVSIVRAIATEACRQAENADILIERVKEELDIEIEIISPKEEAQLVLAGCTGVISEKQQYGVVIDIGGGSTEVIWLRVGKSNSHNRKQILVVDSMSLPYGVVTFRDTFIHSGSNKEVYYDAHKAITKAMQFFIEKNNIRNSLDNDKCQVIASSGTVTTLASLVLGMKIYDRQLIDNRNFSTKDMQRIGTDLFKRYLDSSEDKIVQGIEIDFLANRRNDTVDNSDDPNGYNSFTYSRMGLLASGTIIFDAIVEALGHGTLKIADRGIREGILFNIIENMRFYT